MNTTERRRLGADNLLRGTNLQECVITKDGVKECIDGEFIWNLADPDTTDISNNFLKGSKDLTGTLKLGAAVKTIGKNAFLDTKLTGLDLSDAGSLVKIGAKAFLRTRITDTTETPFNVPTYKKNSFPKRVSIVKVSIPGLKECADAQSGTEPCWELDDPDMTDIPADFLNSNPDLTGTLKLGAAVKTIGNNAFLKTKLTGLDLSQAVSLVSIGQAAFKYTVIVIVIVRHQAFIYTESGWAASFSAGVSIVLQISPSPSPPPPSTPSIPGLKKCADAPSATEPCWELVDPDMTDIPKDFLKGNPDLTGTLKLGAAVKTIGPTAFYNSKLAGLDLSQAASLESIGAYAFQNTDIAGTIETPFKVPTYYTGRYASFPPGVTIVKIDIDPSSTTP
jgi:hypothetical protein